MNGLTVLFFVYRIAHAPDGWRQVPLAMTPSEFIAKWQASELKERSAAQEHFIDLCRLLGEPTPAEADPTGERYCFERGARKDSGGDGWADVWKRGCFAWEYKGKHANLNKAFNQLRQYALALQNPPLLIVSDMVAIPHQHELDQQRQQDARIHAARSGRRQRTATSSNGQCPIPSGCDQAKRGKW